MAVHGDDHFVFIGERGHALGDADGGRCGDGADAERFRHFESALNFVVGETGVEAVIVGVDGDAGVVEFLFQALEMVHGDAEAPVAQIVAGFFARGDNGRIGRSAASSSTANPPMLGCGGFELRCEDFAFSQSNLGHGVDHSVDDAFRRQIAKAISLHA